MDTITVKQKFPGRYPKVQDINGISYGVVDDVMLNTMAIDASYDVEIQTRQVNNPKTGKTFNARDIVRVAGAGRVAGGPSHPVERKPDPLNTPSNGAKEGLELKNKVIKQTSALGNAVAITSAVANVWASTGQTKDWTVDDIRKQLATVKQHELTHNYNILGLEHTEETIPF